MIEVGKSGQVSRNKIKEMRPRIYEIRFNV